MASIIKRKKSYSGVYSYTDDKGETKQKWETWHTHQEALKRKAEIENQQFSGTFIPPNNQTVSEFLHDFVVLYGEKNWSMSTYDGNTGLRHNYINPLIGDVPMQQIDPRFVDQFNRTLEHTKPVVTRNRKPKDEFLPAQTRDKIHKHLSCAFKQAVKWEIIQRNPFELSMYKRPKYKRRDIWNAETNKKALDECEDGKLYISMNLAFACSMREGEILGLTWDNVHILDDDIGRDDAHVCIDKELQRVSKRTLETLNKKGCLFCVSATAPEYKHKSCSQKAENRQQYTQNMATENAGIYNA